MMLRMLAACCLIAGTCAAAPAASPVTVSDCRGGIDSLELMEIAAYDVTFRNLTAVPADLVRITIPYGRRKKSVTFDIRGTFAPNVDVTRALRKTIGIGVYAYEKKQNPCRVERVHFADGSTWSAPDT